MSKVLVFGALTMLFVATMASVGVVVATGADEGALFEIEYPITAYFEVLSASFQMQITLYEDGSVLLKNPDIGHCQGRWQRFHRTPSSVTYTFTIEEGGDGTLTLLSDHTAKTARFRGMDEISGYWRSETPTEKQPGIPGFEVLVATAGLLAVAYLLRGRR